MRESIKVKNSETNFKYRVAGILIKDGKVLLDMANDNGFLCLPGGYVELGETSDVAILREMKEELGKAFIIDKYCGIIENFFTKKNEKIHELSIYYLLATKDEIKVEDYDSLENDKGNMIRHSFRWIPLKEINNYDIRPDYLKDLLQSEDMEFIHKIYKEK